MSDVEDRPDHLPLGGDADRTLDVEAFLAKIESESEDVTAGQLLRSDICPQPYDQSEDTIEDWERLLTIEAHPNGDGEKVFRLRVEGEGSDSERWIQIPIRYRSLEDVR